MANATLVALAVMVLAACGRPQDSNHGTKPREHTAPGDLRQIRRLPVGEDALNQRPLSCQTTHAVLIADGKPSPRQLSIRSGACLIWANKSDADLRVVAVQPHPDGGRTTHITHVSARTSSHAYGPLERLTPERALIDQRRRREKAMCSYHAIGLGEPTTTAPVEHSYTILPGGAQGTIIVHPLRKPTPSHGRGTDLQRLRELRCGAVLLEEQPAACQDARAVLIADGKPSPSHLQLKVGTSVCLFWGNEDATHAVVEPEARGSRTRAHPDIPAIATAVTIAPRAATTLGTFIFTRRVASRGNVLAFTIQPSGAKATISFR